MRFSSLARVAVVLAMTGCAHAAAPPPSGGAEPAARAQTAEPRLDPHLDPSEEITPEELASIPEPVPGAAGAESAGPAAGAASAPAGATSVPGGALAVPGGASAVPAPATPGAAWRVQIFASPDLAAADSVAKSASALLEAPYAIEFEGALYKVRLGSFASEQEAQALRDRAVKSGFLGAFRVRSVTR